ncbi:DUF4129 domain-containing protein [Fibrella aquatilis]|uniref:DUF4129 domain-containing protein n=1 Tax=Fibrella aquatilis TaxID=2817059 RepID=A0A939G925_9BACT|nr:DUF4129 domain-containing protein [Fibrella aquatilis]MBO0934081.1 DUF4129 domain-containing protein [Fibrella aquatilis]
MPKRTKLPPFFLLPAPTPTRWLACLLTVLLLLAGPTWAQQPDSLDGRQPDDKNVVVPPDSTGDDEDFDEDAINPKDTIHYPAADDNATLTPRSFDASQLHDLRLSRDYQYGTDLTDPSENVVERFLRWLFDHLRTILSVQRYGAAGQYLVLLVIGGLAVWLLYKADILADVFTWAKPRAVATPYDVLDENIHVIDFSQRISDAVAQRNYRMAVRLLYLQTLKRLTDAGRIAWQADKTNRQYVYELATNAPANSTARAEFEALTTQFEYVWYGDFPVDDVRYERIREQSQAFDSNFSRA